MDAGLERAQGFDKLQGLVCQDPAYKGLKLIDENGPQFVSDVVSHALKNLHKYGEVLAEAIASQHRMFPNGERFIPHPERGALYLDRNGHLVQVERPSIIPMGSDGREIVACDGVRPITGPDAGRLITGQEASDAIRLREGGPTYWRGEITSWLAESSGAGANSPATWPEKVLDNSLDFGRGIFLKSGTAPAQYFDAAQIVDENRRCTYCSNNNVVAFITPAGQLRVAPWTQSFTAALEAASYTRAEFYVPLSNGEFPEDQSMQAQWRRLQQAAHTTRETERRDSLDRAFEERQISMRLADGMAQDLAEPEVSAGRILRTDGMEFRYPGGGEAQTFADRYQEEGRVDLVGTYCSNNGLLAFVDEHGECFVVRLTRRHIERLQAAGYQEKTLYVPFSNGEIPTDPSAAQTLKAIRAQRYED